MTPLLTPPSHETSQKEDLPPLPTLPRSLMRRPRLLKHILLPITTTSRLSMTRAHFHIARLRIPTRHRRRAILAQDFDGPVVRLVRDLLVALAAVVVDVGEPVR